MNRFIVVGAGPAGLSLSLQLARGGAVVSLVEARRDFTRGLRGDALMPSGLEALIRMGLWDSVAALPHRPLQGWQVWIEGRRLFAVDEPMGSLLACRLVRQQDLLGCLLAEALPLPGFDWRPGQLVSGLLERQGRIAGVRLAGGEELEADLVVACDGRESSLRQASGLRLQPKGSPLELLWLQLPGVAIADGALGGAGAEGMNPTQGSFLTLMGGGAIASACLGAGGELQLGWLLQPEQPTPQRSPGTWAEAVAKLAPPALAAVLRQRGQALEKPQRLRVQVGEAQRWQRPGLLLLGDAAHPMSPVRAQGINLALRDSLVAARALLQVPGSGHSGQRQRALDQAAAAVEQVRRSEVRRMQSLQRAELRQGHWIGHHRTIRHGLSLAAPVVGPLARRVWMARQRPLREGTAWV